MELRDFYKNRLLEIVMEFAVDLDEQVALLREVANDIKQEEKRLIKSSEQENYNGIR